MFSSRWLLAHYRLSWQRLSPIYCISRLAGRKWDVDMKQKLSYKEERAHRHNMFSSGLMTVATKDTGSGSWFTQSCTSEDWKVLVNWTFFYVKQEKRHCHPHCSALILYYTITQKQSPHTSIIGEQIRKKYMLSLYYENISDILIQHGVGYKGLIL